MGPVVIVVAILWLGFGASLIGASGVPGVIVGVVGALGVGIGARLTDLARRKPDRSTPPGTRGAQGSPRPGPRNYPRGRDPRGR